MYRNYTLARANNMWSLRIKVFLLTLYGIVQRSMERLTSEGSNYQRIELTGSNYGLYLRFPNPEFELKNPEFEPEFELHNNIGEASACALSLDEAQALFAAIASTCERQEVGVAQIGLLRVKTDARPNPRHPDTLNIRFGAPIGLNIDLGRQRVMSACEEFSSIFGPRLR